ncbi:alpha/beta hydrolase [Curtobacterium sp. SORGH_AS_0776]|uniref:alpha/beta fold hydrolase n=1 Tax=Curtobacterium sp. SORGH_AS_0776 TaxID=3041798 RepID=UPI00285E9E9F|nr:alpha/beta hydrolase [Curtobacterium sp. SORGH_AS_0776]MDR6171706.1 pimeloyl-ACP methyl ester carboxylesterase [Curtobacterium sp. SORGH_AS_0776]
MQPPVLSPYQSLMAATPVVHRSVQVDGRTTHFWEYGPSDATRTVLAVHGFRGDHHGLETIAAHLDGVRVIVPDLPGFGISDPLPVSDIDSYVAWLRGFHAALGLGADTVVLGHSFGSIVVAATVAAGLATRLLVLVNPIAAPALQGPRAVGTAIAIAYYRAGAVLPKPLGLGLLRNPAIVRVMSLAMLKSHDRDLRRWVHDQHDRYFSAFANRTSVLEAFRTSVTHDVAEYADRITVPVLMIAAERDDITAVPEQRALAARLADAELVVVPHVGHLVHYETPGAAASAVLRRMADAPKRGRKGAQQGSRRAPKETPKPKTTPNPQATPKPKAPPTPPADGAAS